jgi:hypothetical protein
VTTGLAQIMCATEGYDFAMMCPVSYFESLETQRSKGLAIEASGSTTRATASAASLKRRRGNRDFFVLKTTVAAAHRTLQRTEFDVSQFGEPHLITRSDHPLS